VWRRAFRHDRRERHRHVGRHFEEDGEQRARAVVVHPKQNGRTLVEGAGGRGVVGGWGGGRRGSGSCAGVRSHSPAREEASEDAGDRRHEGLLHVTDLRPVLIWETSCTSRRREDLE